MLRKPTVSSWRFAWATSLDAGAPKYLTEGGCGGVEEEGCCGGMGVAVFRHEEDRMPISNPWSRLSQDTVETVPTMPGVYEIATLVRSTIYIGRTDGQDLRRCLRAEVTEPRRRIRQQALYFRYEPTSQDDQRHHELLQEYARAHRGKIPPLNQDADVERLRAGAKRVAHAVARHELRAVS